MSTLVNRASSRRNGSRFGGLAASLIEGATMLPEMSHAASYATSVLANNPIAFWQLAEVGDPSTGILSAVDSSGNGFNATYGTTTRNGFNSIFGPQPGAGFLGFTNGQAALATGVGGTS